jgi:hypothetical protein
MEGRVASRLAWAVFGFIAMLFVGGVVAAAVVMPADDAVGSLVFGLEMFTFPLVGVLIASRHPRNAIGWLMLAIGLAWGLVGALDTYTAYGLTVEPGSVPRPDVALALSS